MKKNLVESLKKLVVAFGGAKDVSEIKENNIVPIINKIADAQSGNGGNGGNGNCKFVITLDEQQQILDEENKLVENVYFNIFDEDVSRLAIVYDGEIRPYLEF